MPEQPDAARDDASDLAATRATIATQAMRIHALEEAARGRDVEDVLREVVHLADVVAATVGQAPYRALLEGIIGAARHIFAAGGASIALLDHESDELVFEAASGGADVVNRRFPATQGIAGWVVMTGEAIAVSDVRHDPRFARDFAASTGYVPSSILAVPLIVGEEVEGVLEVLDKADAGSFGLADMETLSLFARPAAIAVEQARMVSRTGALLVGELRRVAGERGHTAVAQAAETVLCAGGAPADETLELARLAHRLGRHGESARRLALDVLGAVERYAR